MQNFIVSFLIAFYIFQKTIGLMSNDPSSLHVAEFLLKPNIFLTQAVFCSPRNLEARNCLIGIKQMLLYAALSKIIDSTGKFLTNHALLDLDGESSFISKNCLHSLQLKENKNKAQITCLGSCIQGCYSENIKKRKSHAN